jgi:hypothetical protein
MRLPDVPYHAVYFYRTPDGLADTISRFVADGLAIGQPAVVIARPHVRQRIEAGLAAVGVDAGTATRLNRLMLVDAATAVEAILVDDRPDLLRCGELLDSFLERVGDRSGSGKVRFYGEMAGLLWHAGRRVAALELEEFANQATAHPRCITVCGYSSPDMPERSASDDICAFHTHVMSDTGEVDATR